MRKLILIALLFAGCKNPNYCDDHLDNNCKEALLIDSSTGSAGSDGSEPLDCNVSGCTAPQVCDMTMHKCVQCIDNSTCSETSSTPACYGDVCTLCEKHSDCPTSNTCLPDGTCAALADVAYVNGTTGTTNGTCGKLTPCSSLNAALALSTKYIHVSNTVSELVTIPLNTVKTIIGDRTSTLGDQSPTNLITSKLTVASSGPIVTLTNSTAMDVTFVDIAIAGTAANADAIFASASNNTGVKLTLERCLVDGVGFEGIDMSKGTLVLDRTTVSNNALGGIQLSNTNYTITNSYVTHNNTAGTSAFGGIGLTGGSGSISFSTVAGNLGTTGVFGISCTGVTNGTVTNTIVSGNSSPQIDTGCTYAYSGIPSGTGTNIGDPAMLDSTFHLTSSSPMIDKANSTTVKIDWDGDIRPFGNAPDIGADERNN